LSRPEPNSPEWSASRKSFCTVCLPSEIVYKLGNARAPQGCSHFDVAGPDRQSLHIDNLHCQSPRPPHAAVAAECISWKEPIRALTNRRAAHGYVWLSPSAASAWVGGIDSGHLSSRSHRTAQLDC
jgi:hypothetical protein